MMKVVNIQLWVKYPSGLSYFRSRELKDIVCCFLLKQKIEFFVEYITYLKIWGTEEIKMVMPRVFHARKKGAETLIVFSSEHLEDDVRRASVQFPQYQISVFMPVTSETTITIGEKSYPLLAFVYLTEGEYNRAMSLLGRITWEEPSKS